MTQEIEYRHPSFIRAEAMTCAPLRAHFPKSVEEVKNFVPLVRIRALSSRVLVIAKTRVECAWTAYCDAVPGMRHEDETQQVLDYGAKLDEDVARALFPEFEEVLYAD